MYCCSNSEKKHNQFVEILSGIFIWCMCAGGPWLEDHTPYMYMFFQQAHPTRIQHVAVHTVPGALASAMQIRTTHPMTLTLYLILNLGAFHLFLGGGGGWWRITHMYVSC